MTVPLMWTKNRDSPEFSVNENQDSPFLAGLYRWDGPDTKIPTSPKKNPGISDWICLGIACFC